MTDEEKAEEYAKYWIEKDRVTFRCNFKEMKQAYLDGLSEGREEMKKEYKENAIPYVFELRDTVKDLEKENAELKKNNDKLIEEIQTGMIYRSLKDENTELSNSVTELTNSKTELENKITELEEQIEKMKNCQNCKYENKSSYKHECLHTSKRCAGYENWELAE